MGDVGTTPGTHGHILNVRTSRNPIYLLFSECHIFHIKLVDLCKSSKEAVLMELDVLSDS